MMSEAVEPKKSAKQIERVTIAEPLKPKLQSLCDQANESMVGTASISKSDIANLILERHSGSLCKEELEALRLAHFDEVRFATWMATRLKDARNAGESLSLKDLFEEGKGLMATIKSAPRKTRKSKPKASPDTNMSTESKTTSDI